MYHNYAKIYQNKGNSKKIMKITEQIQSGEIPDNELIEILDVGHKQLGTMSLTEFATKIGVKKSLILQVKKYRENEVIINNKKYYKV